MAISEIFNQVVPKPAVLVLDQLGRGGCAVVHGGVFFSREGAEPVALKSAVYRGDDDRVELDTAALIHEEILLRRLARSDSPSPRLILAIRYEDFERGRGADTNTPEATIIMQLLPPDLKKHMETRPNKRYSVQEALVITRNIFYGLEALHQVGHATPKPHEIFSPTIHRDIKPKNISLSKDGTIIFMDFGLSGPPGKYTSLVGTPDFMDADQFQDMSADERSDIYAVGMTLFFLLTGKYLTDLIKEGENGDRKKTVINKIIRGEHHQMMVSALEQVGITRETHPQLIDFLLKLTHPDRNGRYQNVHDGWIAADKLLSQAESTRK